MRVVVGIDAHKRTHTAVAVDEAGRKLGEKTTTSTTSEANLELLRWAERFGAERRFAVEDCRHLSRRLQADLLAAGQVLVCVPPKLMAHDLVRERTSQVNRLRWHLHELDRSWDPAPRSLVRFKQLDAVADRLGGLQGTLAFVAAGLVGRIRETTMSIHELEPRIAAQIRMLAPKLLGLAGVGFLTAAKIVAELADVRRFGSKDCFAPHNGTAPLPVWSANKVRHRLSRTGNRQLNAAIHRIAITQMRIHDAAKCYLERRIAMGNTKTEALRALKRRLCDVVFRTLLDDVATAIPVDVSRAA
jgi:transposase